MGAPSWDEQVPMNDLGITEQLRANYDSYYDDPSLAAWRRIGALDKANNVVRLCAGLPQRRVIEIGAGDGAILQRLSELRFGEGLYALDISASAIEALKRKTIPRLMEYQQFDGYHIPYGDNTFDLAILSHVVEHVEHERQFLYEAARVARYVFVEVPLEDTSRRARDFVFERVGHINFYSPRTIRWLLQTCNLRIIAEVVTNPSRASYSFQGGGTGVLQYIVKEVLLRLAPRLATRHFCYHGALVCEKGSANDSTC